MALITWFYTSYQNGLRVRNKLVSSWETLDLSGKKENSEGHRVIKDKCANGIVVALSLLIFAKKNLDPQVMKTEENEQEFSDIVFNFTFSYIFKIYIIIFTIK